MLSLGSIIYTILLLINAMAVLSEERFLVRSAFMNIVGLRGGHAYGIDRDF